MAARQRILEQNNGLGNVQLARDATDKSQNGHHREINGVSISSMSVASVISSTTITTSNSSASNNHVLGNGGGSTTGVSVVLFFYDFLFCFA